MGEIPESVMEAAVRAMRDPEGGARMCIARAIMAEREHAAHIAQTHIPEGIHPDDLYRWRDTAAAIAAAIRTGN